MERPSDQLTVPVPSAPIPDLVSFIVNDGPLALISPSFWILKVLEWFNNGENPLDPVLEFVAGDWNQAVEASIALDNLGAFYESLARALREQGVDLHSYWRGNAADAATTYLEGTAKAIDEFPAALRRASDDINAVALGMFEGAQALSGLLKIIADLLIAMGITAAAGAVTAETVIGPVIGALGLGVEAIYLAGQVAQIAKVMAIMRASVGGLLAVTAGYLGAIHSIDRVEDAGGGELPHYDFRWA
jgi:hypothetical protein